MSPFLLLLLLLISFPSLSQSQNSTTQCPLDFSILRKLAPNRTQLSSSTPLAISTQCRYILQSLHLLQSTYLRRTSLFQPPLSSADSCWSDFQSLLSDYLPNFDIRSSCGFQTSWISTGCMNITTKAQFDDKVPSSVLADIAHKCNVSLLNASPCATCTTSLIKLPALYLTGPTLGNVSDCTAYPFIYAAAFANAYGPDDLGTAKCLFNLDFTVKKGKRKKGVVVVAVLAVVAGLGGLGGVGWGGGGWGEGGGEWGG